MDSTASDTLATQTPAMDPQTAQILFEQGAMFIIMDFPEGAEFGIDYNSWIVGPNFKGVKMIPPGIHFISFSSKDKDDQLGPRTGFFCNFTPKEIVVRRWDVKMEAVSDQPVSGEELERFENNREELDRFLGPYPYDKYKQWVSLTNHISKDVLSLLQPDGGIIYSVAQFESEASTTQSRRAAALEEEVMDTDSASKAKKPKLPKLKTVAGTKIKYTSIPKKKYPDGATPAEISKYSLDSSYTLDLLLNERFGKDINILLGEIQYAFVCFLIGQNYDSFEQWKKLVHLLCTSGDAITQYPEAYSSFISILHFQIREIPSDFFVDIVTSSNFLTATLHELFQNLLGDHVDPKLRKKGLSFQKHLTDKFKWDFMSEPDEFAPVVVDC
ncbi:unnamed protein product [Candidula unifasciata]|uniref:Protein AAR2 homolog n=1 Tax=Candidula unifasciata TaxID=100452 RepID=A0A8S4A7H5_9EUPU|nr:unnamed protein product [Candidula unifasciata]